jgi:hypothetical protein
VRHLPADAFGPATDLTMLIDFYGGEIMIEDAKAEFHVDAAYAWGDDREGWEGTATLANVVICGRARSRAWIADLCGPEAVAEWEARAFLAWQEAQA